MDPGSEAGATERKCGKDGHELLPGNAHYFGFLFSLLSTKPGAAGLFDEQGLIFVLA
jgi:hypothetical protein